MIVFQVQHSTKSLDELAIIVEVLEEDLRTGSTYNSSSLNVLSSDPPVSPEMSQAGNYRAVCLLFHFKIRFVTLVIFPLCAGYYSDEYDEMSPMSQSYMTYSPGYSPEYQQALSPTHIYPWQQSFDIEKDWFDFQNCNWDQDSSAFFWTQLQKEESQLRDVSDNSLLATDEHGRT